MKLLKELEFAAEINFVVKGITSSKLMGIINIGAVTLSCNNRTFILDSESTNFWDVKKNKKPAVEVHCRLVIDEETFEDDYTLTTEDLLSKDLRATFYCGIENSLLNKEVLAAEGLLTTLTFGYQTMNIHTTEE